LAAVFPLRLARGGGAALLVVTDLRVRTHAARERAAAPVGAAAALEPLLRAALGDATLANVVDADLTDGAVAAGDGRAGAGVGDGAAVLPLLGALGRGRGRPALVADADLAGGARAVCGAARERAAAAIRDRSALRAHGVARHRRASLAFLLDDVASHSI